MDNTSIQKQEPPNKPETKTSKFNFLSFLLYTLLVVFGIIVAMFALSFLSSKLAPKPEGFRAAKDRGLIKIIPAAKPAQSSGTVPAKTNLPITAIKKKITQTVNPYILSGVYLAGDKAYALINNQILEEGDTIGEATVEKISLESVVLKVKDKTARVILRNK